MPERIENPATPNDWISGDADVVKDHAEDPFNNFTSPPNIRSLYYFDATDRRKKMGEKNPNRCANL